MARPPYIPASVNMVVRVETPKPTLAALELARDRELRNLDHRQAERARALSQVESLDRQIANVKASIADLDERIAGVSAVERVAHLESQVADLKREVAELRNPRDGREFS